MKIDKHISALLYEHDCVIVPDFGGFVGSYAPAKIHRIQHIFTPPHKNITFNKNLKSNDGLLADQIVRAENKTFTEAKSILNSFVTECNAALKRGEKVIIEDVGSIYNDIERNIQFDPDNSVNYLLQSYGMTQIQSLPIKREKTEMRTDTKFTDREPVPQERKRNKVLANVVTGVAIVVASSLILLSLLQADILKNINYSALNPFTEKANPLYVNRSEMKPSLSDKDFNSPRTFLPANELLPVTPIAFVKDVDSKLVVRLNENVTVEKHETDKTSVVKNTSKQALGLKYHVVSGCFKIKANAFNFVAMLKAKNIQASVIGKNKDGLFIVSCGDFARKEEAYTELARIRSINTQAWMLEQ